MLKVVVKLKGVAPLQFSAPIQSTRSTGEGHDDFEERTWMERLHVDGEGRVFIPPGALKNCLAAVAKHLSESVPGKGKATYTKHFLAGTMVTDPLILTVNGKALTKSETEKLRLFVPSDGKKGGGSRVYKNFPIVRQWETEATVYLLDPLLIAKPEKVQEYLNFAGQFIGLMAFRPQNGGYFGRFTVSDFKVEKLAA